MTKKQTMGVKTARAKQAVSAGKSWLAGAIKRLQVAGWVRVGILGIVLTAQVVLLVGLILGWFDDFIAGRVTGTDYPDAYPAQTEADHEHLKWWT